MWVNFDDLDLHSRVWVFQSDRSFTDSEQDIMNAELKTFVQKWSTHGSQMHASHIILHNCFVIIAADEQKQSASGCSIDSFTGLFKTFGEQFKLSFFDRFAIAYKSDAGVEVVSLNVFKELISTESINENTRVFNNLISTKQDLLNKWELPLHESWQKRYL